MVLEHNFIFCGCEFHWVKNETRIICALVSIVEDDRHRTYHVVVGDDRERLGKNEKENNWERKWEMRETKEEILIFGRGNERLERKTESKRI